MNIITNNRPRPMACFADLPAKVQADFDYVPLADHYSPRFVQYKGWWYDVYDSQNITRELARHRVGLVFQRCAVQVVR